MQLSGLGNIFQTSCIRRLLFDIGDKNLPGPYTPQDLSRTSFQSWTVQDQPAKKNPLTTECWPKLDQHTSGDWI